MHFPWKRPAPKPRIGAAFLSHHKCASQWLAKYLARIVDLNGLTYGTTHYSEIVPAGDISLMTNASYPFAKAQGLRGCHIVRNPMSVIVSAYFSHFSTHSLVGWDELARQRKVLQAQDLPAGLFLTTAFLERADFYTGAIGPLYGLRLWNYDDPAFLTLRMEDAVREPGKTLRAAFAFIGFDRVREFPEDSEFAFKKLAQGREVGEANPNDHFRSGDPEDWKNHAPRALIDYVQQHFEPLLTRFYPEVLAM